jgi:hypothetical protein
MAEHSKLERELTHDLDVLGDLVHDDSFYPELYRGLAGVAWTRDGEHVTLSWKRAEELVNEIRSKHDRPSLVLAQTGGEGEISERVRDALATPGWEPHSSPPGHDEAHVDSPHDAPHGGGTHRAE